MTNSGSWQEALAAAGISATRLTADSRTVAPGDVFLAYPGEAVDGRRFIADALARGAAAVLYEASGCPAGLPSGVLIPVQDLKEQAGQIAAEWYGHPARRLWMAGVTGTNGKTSVSQWLAQVLSATGRSCAVIGTLGNGFPGALEPTVNTTPDALLLQQLLHRYAGAGAAAVAMEVSSHALEQGRVNGITYDCAMFTNLTRDHLDYHGTFEAYGRAKARLFQQTTGTAVINLDDAFGQELVERWIPPGVAVLRYGLTEGDLVMRIDAHDLRGMRLTLHSPWGTRRFETGLVGRFNAANLAAVAGAALVAGTDLDRVVAALAALTPVAGRLEVLRAPRRPQVVVDYAHTPDALEKVLQTLREAMAPEARLYCVFGCGGNRDRGKRPEMGAIATRLADVTIITSDNPRREDPGAIIAEVAGGAVGPYQVEPDRLRAIEAAIAQAGAEDVVLVAGKGHERYQEIGTQKLPFSDLDVARQALAGSVPLQPEAGWK